MLRGADNNDVKRLGTACRPQRLACKSRFILREQAFLKSRTANSHMFLVSVRSDHAAATNYSSGIYNLY